jgi:exopolysaccharide biosynthesis polyprenyl glycosylphosphotransferase
VRAHRDLSAPAAPVPRGLPRPPSGLATWQRRYSTIVATIDLAIIGLCAGVGILAGPGSTDAALRARVLSGIAAAALLVACLLLSGAWNARILGNGAEEFRRLCRAVAASAVVLGLGGVALDVVSVRMWVFGVVPLCGLVCVLARYALRSLLHEVRREEHCMLSVLAVGSEDAIEQLVQRTRRDKHLGWVVTGACTPTGLGTAGGATIAGVPVVGDLDGVGAAVHTAGYRVVAVAPAPGWGALRLRRLAWQLEETGTELAVDPGLLEVAGPRLHVTPVEGLPLLRLTEPRFSGLGHLVKAATDRVVAAVLLLLMAPLLGAIAVAVRLDGGPVFCHQERVGAGGRTFRLVTYRTAIGTDPPGTRVGAVLRRYSLDELPQLFNVLAGSMSLVGPRPLLPRDVAGGYGEDTLRRLRVRPGLTGLGQVDGRPDLSWEETVRLDLRYVENWSVSLDITILWKALTAMVDERRAY